MWQEAYGIRWAEENGVLYIQGGGKRDPFLLPPFAGKDAKFLDGLLLSLIHISEPTRP